ncbi:asparaginase [Robertmurraya yapensis]|uniref:asparaginase n=1 Tax=Bacillus yapensis TaxID=2492960 RepID=A0A3S0KGK4_9BACI|nr:asparaginase [Bacillus yapensis]RTR30412.1 asparaginase [Bacillus yapensis]TKS95231.1 asparaginase [Bacillus yapensis]
MKKKILVIHTGGTISMSEDETTGAVKPSEINPMTDKTQGLVDFADLIIEEPFNLPSPHVTPKEMLQLKKLIGAKSKEHAIAGVVITHGTDTLEETAYFLDLTMDTKIPIVVTGAMRSSNEIGSDGLYNLITSIKVAASDEAVNKGVLVVLNDEIHTAKNVTKTHTSNISTFQSPQYGPIGVVTKRGVLFHHCPTGSEHYPIQDVSKKVVLIKAHAGMDSSLLYAINELPCDGIVIEALGQGNLPPATIPGIQALIKNNIPVVFVSRCFNGIAQDTYAYDGGGKQLKELGVIFSNGLNGQKARLKLLIMLDTTSDFKKIEEAFSI